MRFEGTLGRSAARAGALLACAALLAGCASMPDSGEVSRVGGEQRADVDSQVRVYGVRPQKGDGPTQIVNGFLEATTSDEDNYSTALQYLVPRLRKVWKPNSKVTVLDQGPVVYEQTAPGNAAVDSDRGRSAVVQLSGQRAATVDSKHAYRPDPGKYLSSIHLTKVGSEWRIDAVDDGLVLTDADFQRIYRSVDTYYYAALGPDSGSGSGSGGGRREVLVADPVYLRQRINLLGFTVQTLLDGPTGWLRPVVDSAFPGGAKAKSVSLDDSQRLRVRLDRVGASGTDSQRCELMAAQLYHTVQHIASAKLASVELQGPDGGSLCSLPQDQARAYAPDQLAGRASEEFYIDTEHRLVSLAGGDDTTAERVAGPFGEGAVPLGSVAVRRDERFAAGVKADGSQLYVAALATGAALGRAVVTSTGPSADQRLSAPSWDGYGDLWIADRNPSNPRLLMLRDGAGTATTVAVPGLAGGRIESLRVSADGVRIAMLVGQGGHTTLWLGRIERSGTTDKPVIQVTGLRQVTPQLEDVKAASWAGTSRLVVVGRQSGSVQGQIQYVDTDGSASYTPTLPGIGGVASVAASENQDKPLLAQLGKGIFIFRLPLDANWREVSPAGSSPVYPG
jgi:two-component system sensor histidine kinase MtrB